MTTPSILAVPLAYLLGSLPFAVIVSRTLGLADPRSYGSGNPGATNVLRSGNKLAAALTLLGDLIKGWLAVTVAVVWGATPSTLALTSLAVFLGHLYPAFLRLKGGKGVATAAGVLMGLNPLLGIGALVFWLLVATLSQYSSLAAVSAAIFATLAAPWILGIGPTALAVLIMSVMLIWRHRQNIERLRAGTETRIGHKKTPKSPSAPNAVE